MKPPKYFLFLVNLLYSAECLKILAVFPYTARSHAVTYIPLLEKLRESGHELRLAAFFSLKYRHADDIKLLIPPNSEIVIELDSLVGSRFEQLYLAHFLHSEIANKRCDFLLSSKAFGELLKSNETYDVILTEHFTTSCHISPLVEKHQTPFIVIHTNALMAWAAPWVDVPYNPAYMPVLFLDFPLRMNFWKRLDSLVMWIYVHVHYYLVIAAQDDSFLKNPKGIISHELMQNASLILTNSHFTYHIPRPLVPRTVEVAGMHIEACQQLPKVHFYCFSIYSI
uniref:UDP-glycosyltransferase n=1 Tax=Photinus pyralis TaxID=7054 RepID=A0A1Y1K6S0_PHOPY